ncbi:3-epi-6-deoxocathasterone 23-monooxygenase CYP90C1 [Phoenix dactylifera]|uniref:Cytochrome P450 90D2 n=1 Tax=Phoenix dactylifera TaxID=42345 RepID=A0A8B7D4X4_PHODC|nr:3-epi-6-deoxocathasterone 23-monooxygenase CYP90C1 [Phoenix dactylifera]
MIAPTATNNCTIPKGSMGWPVIGETLEFIACGYASRPLSFLKKRQLMYGKVFKSHILGIPIIISTDAEVNKVVLQNDGRTFIPFYPKSIMELLGKSSILKTNGDLHKRLHGLVGGFLKSPSLKEHITKDIEKSVMQSLVNWKYKQCIYIQDETKEVTFEVLVRILLGIGPGEEMWLLKREFREFIKGLICLPIKLPGTRLYKSLKAKERMLKLIKKIIESKMRSSEHRAITDVAVVLLKEMNDTTDLQRLTIDSICGNIIEMMIPGEDTVPTLMTLAIKYLSDSPSALKLLLEENIKLKREKMTSGKCYAWTDYMSLPFTQHVISESLRMGNIINAIWRKTLEDVKIKSYLIPKGWCVLASLTSIHLDEENYEKPLEFDPWRWQREGSSQSTFTPFGGGQRLCPGMELSRLEVSIFLHHFVTTFSWVAEEDTIITFPTVKMKKRLPITLSPIATY